VLSTQLICWEPGSFILQLYGLLCHLCISNRDPCMHLWHHLTNPLTMLPSMALLASLRCGQNAWCRHWSGMHGCMEMRKVTAREDDRAVCWDARRFYYALLFYLCYWLKGHYASKCHYWTQMYRIWCSGKLWATGADMDQVGYFLLSLPAVEFLCRACRH